MVWQIDSWVTGNELYKAYIDPSLGCADPYPFAVTEINMPMTFALAADIYASVDIEAVDLTDPSCPFPGDLISLSSQYQLTAPEPGVYSIWIPLDSPVIVNGPFFAGFFIGVQLVTLYPELSFKTCHCMTHRWCMDASKRLGVCNDWCSRVVRR